MKNSSSFGLWSWCHLLAAKTKELIKGVPWKCRKLWNVELINPCSEEQAQFVSQVGFIVYLTRFFMFRHIEIIFLIYLVDLTVVFYKWAILEFHTYIID